MNKRESISYCHNSSFLHKRNGLWLVVLMALMVLIVASCGTPSSPQVAKKTMPTTQKSSTAEATQIGKPTEMVTQTDSVPTTQSEGILETKPTIPITTTEGTTTDPTTEITTTDPITTTGPVTTTENQETQPITMDKLIAETRHFEGKTDAPVVIIEFSDFQCPYCSKFAYETKPDIVKQYIDTGIVRFGYRHAAYHEGDALVAAEASECAADQGAFWKYHDVLIYRLAVEGKHDFPKDLLKKFATDLDLDNKVFDTCLESGKYRNLVKQETEDSMKLGVEGTPTFIVNGKHVVGAVPLSEFQKAIDAAKSGETDPKKLIVEQTQTEQSTSPENLMAMIVEHTRHFQGDSKAPITIVEFSDFQCPYCSKFAVETAPKIEQEYVDKGIVRFGYIHAAYHGGDALVAAEASECAADQDAFWKYEDLLSKRLAVESKHDFPKEVLKQFAGDLKLNMQLFNACLDSGKYAQVVKEQTQFSSELGVQGTPTFAVNGKALVGAQPFEVFQQVIESEKK